MPESRNFLQINLASLVEFWNKYSQRMEHNRSYWAIPEPSGFITCLTRGMAGASGERLPEAPILPRGSMPARATAWYVMTARGCGGSGGAAVSSGSGSSGGASSPCSGRSGGSCAISCGGSGCRGPTPTGCGGRRRCRRCSFRNRENRASGNDYHA